MKGRLAALAHLYIPVAAVALVWSGVRVRLNASGQSPNRLHCSALLLLAPLGPTLASSQSTAPCKVVSPPLTPYTPRIHPLRCA